MMQGFVERLYAYTGDPHTLEFLQNFVDYELEHGTTPPDYVWGGVPYPSANPGAKNYSGWSQHGEDFVEPHVVGEEMTGNTKYLRAAIRCARALVGYAYLRLYENLQRRFGSGTSYCSFGGTNRAGH